MSLFTEIQTQVRSLLKAAVEKADDKDKKAAVPGDPGDPDKLQPDYRVGNASPTDKDADEAKEETGKADEEGADPAADGAEAGAADGAEEGAEAPEAGEGDGDEEDDDDQRPIAKGFDEFGNRDLDEAETRALLKALDYGVTPPIDPKKILDGGEDLKGMLDDILALLVHQQGKLEANGAVMSDLLGEIARLKKGQAENEREITKALSALGNPLTAPAEAPRGIAKSFVPPTAVPTAINGEGLANEIFHDLKAGRIDSATAMAKCREARGFTA